ncbi:MAG TPA: nucleotidyltransferase family protein, partial [Dongiaceae bacterium]|nr:nucleotidyltransferase family protein [Dongiaceae bacterium]
SRRMGSCKQLLPLGGSTVISRCVEALCTGGASSILVVVAEEGNGVAEAVQGFPVRIVVNQEKDGDMASSVRAGRDALTEETSGVIVSLCDYPLVSAGTITGLIARHRDSPGRIIIPRHGERRGHPLLFPRTVLNELADDRTLRDLVRRDPGRICCHDVDDPGVLVDMDTPDDYRRIRVMMERFDHVSKGAAP